MVHTLVRVVTSRLTALARAHHEDECFPKDAAFSIDPPRSRCYPLHQGLAQAPDSEITAAIASAKVSRALKMEKPLYALLALADSASVGADPAKAAAALDGVSAADVKKAAATALKSGISVASVGNIAEVRVCGAVRCGAAFSARARFFSCDDWL